MMKEYFSSFGTRIILYAFSALTAIITARVLGPEGRGAYALLLNFMAILLIAGTFGVEIANVYFTGQKKFALSVLTWNSVLLSLVSGAALVLLAGMIYRMIPHVFTGISEKLFLGTIIFMPFFVGRQLLGNMVLGLQKITLFNFFSFLQGAFGIMLLSIGVVFFPQVWMAIAAYIAAAVFGFFLYVKYLHREGAFRGGALFDSTALRESITFGLKGQMGNALQFMNYRLDTFFINFFVGVASVGVYSVAVILSELLWHLPNSLAYVLFPRTAGSADGEAMSRAASKASRLLFGLSLFGAILLAASGYWMLKVFFGEAFVRGITALWILLPGTVFFAGTITMAAYIGGRGYVLFNSIVSAVGLVATIALNILLVPRWGINGAAFASTVSYGISAFLLIFFYRKLSGAPLREMLIPARSDWRELQVSLRRLVTQK